MTAERTSRNPLTLALSALVRGYQLVVSPWLAPRCRYYPSCSSYGLQALAQHGPIRGTALAVWRVLRCNPWSAGGVDEVPSRQNLPWRRHRQETDEHGEDRPGTDGPPSSRDRIAYGVDQKHDHRLFHQSPPQRI